MVTDLNRKILATELPEPISDTPKVPLEPSAPTAVILVSGFNGLGLHAFWTLNSLYPRHYKNFVFVSVGQVDYSRFSHQEEIVVLTDETHKALEQYERHVRSMGGAFDMRAAVSADVIGELETICRSLYKLYPRAVFFGGQLNLGPEFPWTRLLHGYVTYGLQERLHASSIPMMILPTRLDAPV